MQSPHINKQAGPCTRWLRRWRSTTQTMSRWVFDSGGTVYQIVSYIEVEGRQVSLSICSATMSVCELPTLTFAVPVAIDRVAPFSTRARQALMPSQNGTLQGYVFPFRRWHGQSIQRERRKGNIAAMHTRCVRPGWDTSRSSCEYCERWIRIAVTNTNTSKHRTNTGRGAHKVRNMSDNASKHMPPQTKMAYPHIDNRSEFLMFLLY